MRTPVLFLVLSGCFISGGGSGPPVVPPPIVDQMTPESGAYGADVAIYGSGFAAGRLDVSGATVATPPQIVSWSDTEIHLRVPFPAEAMAFSIITDGGTATTPTFTPISTWTAGPSLALPGTILEARMFGSALVVLGVPDTSGVTVSVIDGATATVATLPGITGSADRRYPTHARLVDDGAGGFAVLANAGGTLQVFTLAGTTPTTFDTTLAGTLIAAGRDTHGMFAWLQVADPQGLAEVERVRPGATAMAPWHVERGPISSPSVLDARVAADGTLVIAYGADSSTLFDYMQEVAIARLPPSASGYDPRELPDSLSWDDYIASAQLAIGDDGKRMLVAYSTQQNDETTDHVQVPDVRDANGTWQAAGVVSPALETASGFAYTPAGLATLTASDHDLTLVPDVAHPTQVTSVPLWPALPAALVVDASGAPRPVIALGTKMWFPAPPKP